MHLMHYILLIFYAKYNNVIEILFPCTFLIGEFKYFFSYKFTIAPLFSEPQYNSCLKKHPSDSDIAHCMTDGGSIVELWLQVTKDTKSNCCWCLMPLPAYPHLHLLFLLRQ